jgi:DNA-binding transcriptional LysR family regulator
MEYQVKERSALDFEPVFSEDLVLIVPPDHPFAERLKQDKNTVVDFCELESESFIRHNRQKALRLVLDNVFQSYKLEPKELFEVSSTRMAIEFVSGGIGVSFVPKMFALNFPRVRIIPTQPALTWNLGILYRKTRKLPVAEKGLIRLLSNVFKTLLQQPGIL